MERFHRHVVLSFVLIAFLETGQSVAQSTSSYKRYGVKSCIVEYTLGGSQTGSETLYFDRYGMREARFANKELNVMNVKQKLNTIVLIDFDWTINIDLDKKQGQKRRTLFFRRW